METHQLPGQKSYDSVLEASRMADKLITVVVLYYCTVLALRFVHGYSVTNQYVIRIRQCAHGRYL